MTWQLIRGPSGKVCFELDVERGLVRVRHSKGCSDIVDLTAFGLVQAALTVATPGYAEMGDSTTFRHLLDRPLGTVPPGSSCQQDATYVQPAIDILPKV